MDRNVNIVTDLDGKKFVLINDIRFKAKKRYSYLQIFLMNTQIQRVGWH
jgi:hypothetical protein